MSSDIRYHTQEIKTTDCVGDSSAKHNYNFLSLDTQICNISSLYIDPSTGFIDLFTEFQNTTGSFEQMTSLFSDHIRFNKIATTVEYLSSYWTNHEFTVHYPLNISTINNLLISCPTVNQADNKLISLVNQFIKNNYIAEDYNEGTVMNVILFLYNVPVNPSDPNDLVSSKRSPEFSYLVRHMYVEKSKQDVHIGNGKLFKFLQRDNKWKLLSIETGGYDNTKLPVLKTQEPPRITSIQSPTGRQIINLSIERDIFCLDLYYEVIHSGIYFAGYTDINITIQSNAVVGSNRTNIAALTIAGFTEGDIITIVNNGTIVGYGGQGGQGVNLGEPPDARNNGKKGGPAIRILYGVSSLLNNGIIGGGGGGGGGGIATYTNTSYLAQYSTTPIINTTLPTYQGGGGGGGGGGYEGGSGGIRGLQNQILPNPALYYKWNSSPGSAGSAGGTFDGGVGGSGYQDGGDGGGVGESGASTGSIDFIGRQLPPLGGASGEAIIGRSFIQKLYTTIPNSRFSYGDIRGSL